MPKSNPAAPEIRSPTFFALRVPISGGRARPENSRAGLRQKSISAGAGHLPEMMKALLQPPPPAAGGAREKLAATERVRAEGREGRRFGKSN